MVKAGTTAIGDESWVSMALFRTVLAGVLTGAVALVGAIWWASSVNSKLEQAVETGKAAVTVQAQQSADISAIRESLATVNINLRDVQRDLEDQWKLSDTMWWTAEFQRLNPTLTMPDIERSPSRKR